MSSLTESTIASRAGIKKHTILYTLAQIKELIESDSIISAPWNRTEVKQDQHIGKANTLLESIVAGRSINMLLGFWNGNALTSSEIKPTKESPLQITEGGHRLRWLRSILVKNTITFDNKNLAEIQRDNRSLYDFIMEYKITVEIKTHESGIVPEKYMKEEYRAVNTGGTNLSPGEIARASTDENSIELGEMFKRMFKHRMDKMKAQDKNRDKGTAILNALLRSMNNNDFSLMKSTLTTLPIIDDVRSEVIEAMIVSLGELEQIKYESASDKVKKAMSTGICQKLHGTFFYALCNDTTPPTALDTIGKFFEISTVDEETYKANVKNVMGTSLTGGNGGSRMNNEFYTNAWVRLRTIVTPLVREASALGAPTYL